MQVLGDVLPVIDKKGLESIGDGNADGGAADERVLL